MNLEVHVVHFMYKSFPSFLNSCLVSYVCPFIVFVNRKSVFKIYSVNQNVFIHFVPAKTSLVSVIITKMNVVFFTCLLFLFTYIYIKLYTLIKYSSVENLHRGPQPDFFLGYLKNSFCMYICLCCQDIV